jgi:hypothetical protein
VCYAQLCTPPRLIRVKWAKNKQVLTASLCKPKCAQINDLRGVDAPLARLARLGVSVYASMHTRFYATFVPARLSRMTVSLTSSGNVHV